MLRRAHDRFQFFGQAIDREFVWFASGGKRETGPLQLRHQLGTHHPNDTNDHESPLVIFHTNIHGVAKALPDTCSGFGIDATFHISREFITKTTVLSGGSHQASINDIKITPS
jgi:hypothetical protein